MTPDFDSRRSFVKKSLAASIAAAQPAFFAGLVRANGGGEGTGTTDPWGNTTIGDSTAATTAPWDSTYVYTDPWGDTTVPLETTVPSTDFQTTAMEKQKTLAYEIKLYLKSVSGYGDTAQYTFTTNPAQAMPIYGNADQLPSGKWPSISVNDLNDPKVGGFPMTKIEDTTVNTDKDLVSGYPKFFPAPLDYRFVDPVKDSTGAILYYVKGYRYRVSYLWVYQGESVPSGAGSADSVP